MALFWYQALGTPATMGQEEDGHGYNPRSLAWPQQQLCRNKASIRGPCLGVGRQPESQCLSSPPLTPVPHRDPAVP